MIDVPRVYAIADRCALGERSLADAVLAMADAGVRWIQVRCKQGNDLDLWRDIESICRSLEGSEVSLWIDDRVDMAAALPVCGVHLGQRDLPIEQARQLLPSDRWIGLSTHRIEQVVAAESKAPEVIAVGPVYSTTSKVKPDPVVGLSLVRRARRATDRPLVAIGGIDAKNLQLVLDAGADGVVLLGELCQAEDIGRTAREIVALADAA